MPRWYRFCYSHNYLVAIAVVFIVSAIMIATSGCDPNTADTSQPNCPFGQHAVWKGGTATHAKWDCEKG